MNREIKVVDFTHGTRDSERIDTSIPFTSQFKECKTIQQSNVVMGAFINKNIKDIKNIDTNVDDISDSIDEIQDELVDIEQNKQDKLISGENIKTINNQDILGSGDINVGGSWGSITGDIENQTDLQTALDNKLSVRDDGYGKEVDELLNLNSGAYIPQTGFLSTYNLPTSVVLDPTAINELTTKNYVDNEMFNKQDKLVSGTNIKTINNENILGSGNINIDKQFCELKLITDTTLEFTGTAFQNNIIPFDSLSINNGNFSLNNNGIKIGSGIEIIKINFMIDVRNFTAQDDFTITILKNNTPDYSLYFPIRKGETTLQALINVNENDLIQFRLQNQGSIINNIRLWGRNDLGSNVIIEKMK